MKLHGHLLTILCLTSGMLFGQFQTEVSGVGTNAAAFLEIGAGARAMGMGGAYAALANDPTALYYNPAGIVWLDKVQIEFMHNEWLVDTNYDFVGATMPLPFWNGSLGLSFLTLDYGSQPVRTVERPEGTGQTYSARDYAAALTFATALTQQFSFGLSVKYINQQVWNESGGTAALDLGIFYNTGISGLKLGMSMTNFGGDIRLSGRDLRSTLDPDEQNIGIDRIPVEYFTEGFPLPLYFRAGISYEMDYGNFGRVTIASDLLHPKTSTESINSGIEYGFAGVAYLRAGYENLFEENAENSFTFGGGIDYQPGGGGFGFRVDYAYSDWGYSPG